MKNRISYFCFAKRNKYGLSEKLPCCLFVDTGLAKGES